MKAPEVTNTLSYYSVPLELIAPTGQGMGLATGFFYFYEETYYLITNGHVVTGYNAEDSIKMTTSAAFPIGIKTKTMKMIDLSLMDGGQLEKVASALGKRGIGRDRLAAFGHGYSLQISLYHDEIHNKPKWYIHPDFGYNVDVVAIPLFKKSDLPADAVFLALNDYDGFSIEPVVADDVFILGYPFGITDELRLPIWKKGSIATEPRIWYKGLPRLLVDTATRKGMSGSPVIIMRTDVNSLHNDDINSRPGIVYGFVGVYSGRIGEESNAQLGIVWKKEVIEEILKAKVQGTTEFQYK